MYSPYLNENNFEIKDFISKKIHNESNSQKKHSDSLNCLINCSKFRVTLHITQKPSNGKDNIFFIQKAEFSPLFFYDIPSNKIIDEIQSKNEAQKLLNITQKIKTENDVIDKYEQNKKNKMLLFNYIKFPLINANSDNNNNKLSTLIILDDGANDFISNFSTDSSFVYHQTCCISLTISNTNCDFLFSLSDIKDCKEIKIKLNGTVHEQPLFDKEIICYLSSELINNSIKERMEIYSHSDNIENLLGKYFFTKLNDNNYNNIGILFSLKKKSATSELSYDKEYLKTDRYLINKIFIFMDIWLNDNNKKKKYNAISSTNTSSHMIFNYNYKFDDKNKIINNFNSYQNEIDFNYPNYLYNNENNQNNEISNNFNIDNNDNNDDLNSNSKIVYNDINRIYINNGKNLYNDSQIFESNEYSENNDNNMLDYSLYDYYFNPNYSNYDNNDNYNEKSSDLNIIFHLIENYQKYKESEEQKIYNEPNNDNLKLFSIKEKEFDNHSITTENEFYNDIFIKRTLFINMNEELIRKLFEKFEEDKCISNYTITTNMLDINMNLDPNKEKLLSKTNLLDFFDIFKNANQLWLNIPFIDIKGNLHSNCFCPTLSSMILVIKKNKEIIKNLKHIKSKCKKYEGFAYDKYDQDKKLFKIEFEEIKPVHIREILYNKIGKIKKIIGETKIKNKDIMIKNSYFSVLWSIKNDLNIKSSFLAYYSFDFKLIGILMINPNYNQWMTAFSYKLSNYHDYKADYEKNVENVKKMFDTIPIDLDDKRYNNYFKYDYYNYLKSLKKKHY